MTPPLAGEPPDLSGIGESQAETPVATGYCEALIPVDTNKPLRNALSMPYEALSKSRITQALRRLGELAHAEKLTLEVALYGGAVFTLVYGSREATKDVDALVRPAKDARRLAAVVAREQGLPDDWLNDQVKQFLSPKGQARRLPAAEFGPGLKVSVPTAAYLLALKLRACRPRLPGYGGDEEDILFLLRKTKPASLATVAAIYEKFFPGDTLGERAAALVEQVIKEQAS